jgi:hypothetical protein
MHIPCRHNHCRCRCHCRGDVSLPHHHVSFFVVAVAVTVAFATVAVVAAIAAKTLQLSSPQSSMLKDCCPSAVVDGIVVIVIGIVVVDHPPHATDAILDVDDVAHIVCLALGGSWPDPRPHQRQGT